MANLKHKKQTRHQHRLEMVFKDYGPFLLDYDLSDMFEAIPEDPIHCGSSEVTLSKRAIQRLLEEGRAKITAKHGMILISLVE